MGNTLRSIGSLLCVFLCFETDSTPVSTCRYEEIKKATTFRSYRNREMARLKGSSSKRSLTLLLPHKKNNRHKRYKLYFEPIFYLWENEKDDCRFWAWSGRIWFWLHILLFFLLVLRTTILHEISQDKKIILQNCCVHTKASLSRKPKIGFFLIS